MDEKNIANQKITPLHTYESDMADAVRQQEATVIKIALAEKAKKENEEISLATKKAFSMNIFYVIGGVVLIVLAIFSTIFLIQKGKEASQITPIKKEVQTIVHGDNQVMLDITNVSTKDDMINAIINLSKTEIKNKTITSIVPVTVSNNVSTVVTSNEFLNKIETNIPGNLSRSLNQDFMLGIYNDNSHNHLFLILKTNDYDQAFAGMLAWENTLLSDMYKIMNIDVSSLATNIFETQWSDKIIENKDSRIIKDSNGSEILIYMIPDKNKIIITDSKGAIVEILSRLVTQNIKPL